MRDELGYGGDRTDPLRAALATLVAFVVLGFVPLGVFVADLATPGTIAAPFAWSAILTVLAFFLVGSVKGGVVARSPVRSGLETVAIGGAAAALAFAVGVLLRGVA
jgi:VIT1/CCC1 family predicted Fe2+/Mn2+ transporter